MKLTEKVKSLCDSHGITFAALERRLDFGNGTIRKWDNATPSGDKLAKVGDFFGVSVDYLLGRDSAEVNNETKQKLYVLARHLDEIPEDKREKLIKNFEDSINIYLDAIGLQKEDK